MAESAGWKNIKFTEFVVGEKIGGGGVGIVYSGTYLGKPVALKTLVCFIINIAHELQ